MSFRERKFQTPLASAKEPPLRSRQILSGPDLYWVLVDKQGVIGGSFWDILTPLPAPCNTFFLGSVKTGDEANNIAMSLTPLNKPRGFAFTALVGKEPIFFLTTPSFVTGPVWRAVIRFAEPVEQVYFHIGSENGNLSRYSIGCINTDKAFKLTGGLYF